MIASNVRVYNFTLKGITPLLMHADDVEAAGEVSQWRTDPANRDTDKGDDRCPAWTWQTYTYRDESNRIAMPADNIMVALRHAGAKVILKRQKTFKEISQSGLFIPDETCPLLVNGKPIDMTKFHSIKDEPFPEHRKLAQKHGFDLLVKRAAMNGRSKHVRVRPMLSGWTVTGTVQVLSEEITSEKLELLFTLAGNGGLCDWRPSCKTPGRWGQFESTVKRA